MQKILLFSICWLLAGNLVAQKVQEQNLYMLNPFLLNPAFAGNKSDLVSMLGFRSAYTGLNNAPRNLFLSVHTPVSEKAAIGGNLFSDSRGVLNTVAGNIASSYLVKLSSEHKLRFGLSGGFFKQSIQADKVKNANASDPTLSSANVNFTNYNFGFGAAYEFKELQLGVALPDLVSETRSLRNYTNAYARYTFQLQDEKWKISPVVLFQQLPVSPNQLDAQLMVTWHNLIWAQAGFRVKNAGLFSAGLHLGPVSVAYAYEANVGVRSDIANSGHEVVLLLSLKGKKEKAKGQEVLFEEEAIGETAVIAPVAKIDTVNYAERFDKMDKVLAEQKARLDSVNTLNEHTNQNNKEQLERIESEIANLENLKKELAMYLKNIHEFSDSSHIDIAVMKEFDLKHYDYHVAIGAYKNLNYVKFIQKQLQLNYELATVIEQSDDKQYYILSSKKVQNKDEALKEIQNLNGRIHEQYFNESAKVIRKKK